MASQQEIDDIIERIFQDICQMYKDVEFDTRNIHDCLIRLIEIVEEIPTLVGADKKKIVIGVLNLIIHHLHIKETEKQKIIYMLTHEIIDMIIDLVVKLTKTPSKINFKQVGAVVLDDNKVEDVKPDKNVETVDTTKYNYCNLL